MTSILKITQNDVNSKINDVVNVSFFQNLNRVYINVFPACNYENVTGIGMTVWTGKAPFVPGKWR